MFFRPLEYSLQGGYRLRLFPRGGEVFPELVR
jgi:hypothetical protein